MSTLAKRLKPDYLAIALLIALWWLFFWRLFTPNMADRVSLVDGDFSGQFVAFAGYQYQRFTAGEIPLWNPYNNGGLPFIADTQAAVFYPPRLITIALSRLSGGWTYNALQMEMTAHVLVYSLFMYLFVRRLAWEHGAQRRVSSFAAFVSAIIAAYGGFTSGYPPLQLAILEAGIWLPLAALGILDATSESQFRPRGLLLTGFALGMSWLAGHPQTTFFLTYFLLAYLGFRVYVRRYRWHRFVFGAALFGIISIGLAAVQLVPGVEYLLQTTRTGLGFDAKGNGFPFQDLLQFIFPGAVSLWSPLYVGIVGLVLAGTAIWRSLVEARFWALVAGVALLLSFGANSAFFHALYNLLPGLSFFRGQERAAYLVANSLAVLAGIGILHLLPRERLSTTLEVMNRHLEIPNPNRIRQALLLLVGIMLGMTSVMFVLWLGSAEAYSEIGTVVFSTAVALILLWLLPRVWKAPMVDRWVILLAALLVFELFTANLDNSNYQAIPAEDRLAPPELLQPLTDNNGSPYRVDGFRGLTDNYGSLYGIMDMRGISPLFLAGPHSIIERDYINPRAWEVFAVRYVYTDWTELPVASTIVGGGADRWGGVNLHELADPRPYALLIYHVDVAPGDAFAHELLFTADYDPRANIILARDPAIPLHQNAPENPQDRRIEWVTYQPERLALSVTTSIDAIFSLAQVNYPGWRATIGGQPAEILRAYGALSALVIPAGTHIVELTYDPASFKAGAIISLFTLSVVIILSGMMIVQRVRQHADSDQ